MLNFKEFKASMDIGNRDFKDAFEESLQEINSAEFHSKNAIRQTKKLIRDALRTNDEKQKMDAILKALQQFLIILENR